MGKPIDELTDEELAIFERKCDEASAAKAAKMPTDDEGINKMLDDVPFWSNINEDDLDKGTSDAFEAVKAMKLENTLESEVEIRKQRGNDSFARAKKHSIRTDYTNAILYYTEAIQLNGSDRANNSKVYSNRALVHFTLKNYGHCITDCMEAVSLDPTNIKAFFRAADAAFALKKYSQATLFCNHGLSRANDFKPKENKEQNQLECEKTALTALLNKICQAHDEEKKEEKKKSEEKSAKNAAIATKQSKLALALSERQIVMGKPLFDMSNFDGYKCDPYLDNSNNLHWPVLLLYEEQGQSDFIKDFHEATSFLAQLKPMFYPKVPHAEWDTNKEYKIRRIKLFTDVYDTVTKDVFRKEIPLTSSLSNVINYCNFRVPGIPTFYVVPDKS